MFGEIFPNRSMESFNSQHALKIRVMPTAFAHSSIALQPTRAIETRAVPELTVRSHSRLYGTNTKLNSTAVQWFLRYFSFQTKNYLKKNYTFLNQSSTYKTCLMPTLNGIVVNIT
jgi:hypothetical protein